jgi:hypothetical protein
MWTSKELKCGCTGTMLGSYLPRRFEYGAVQEVTFHLAAASHDTTFGLEPAQANL